MIEEQVNASLKSICVRHDLKPDTVRDWVEQGNFPRPFILGKRGLWRFNIKQVDEWVMQRQKVIVKASLVRQAV